MKKLASLTGSNSLTHQRPSPSGGRTRPGHSSVGRVYLPGGHPAALANRAGQRGPGDGAAGRPQIPAAGNRPGPDEKHGPGGL